MAEFTGTYDTYEVKGIREDLANIIYNISPEDTPFVSNIGRETATHTLHEWQTDSLAAVDTANKQLEGDDLTSVSTANATTRVGNYTQISRKTGAVSGTMEATNRAGRGAEKAYQLVKLGSELRRDIEAIALENLGGNAGGSSTARQTATMGAWIKTNDDLGTSGASPTYTSGVPGAARTEGTQRAFTETILKNVISDLWSNGGKTSMLMVGPVNKAKVSAFAGIATLNYDLSGQPRATAIIGAADVYVSDFGVLRVVPNRFQRERDGWLIDPEYAAIASLRNFEVQDLAKTGDAEKFMLIQEWALVVKNEAAHGLCADLTTT